MNILLQSGFFCNSLKMIKDDCCFSSSLRSLLRSRPFIKYSLRSTKRAYPSGPQDCEINRLDSFFFLSRFLLLLLPVPLLALTSFISSSIFSSAFIDFCSSVSFYFLPPYFHGIFFLFSELLFPSLVFPIFLL